MTLNLSIRMLSETHMRDFSRDLLMYHLFITLICKKHEYIINCWRPYLSRLNQWFNKKYTPPSWLKRDREYSCPHSAGKIYGHLIKTDVFIVLYHSIFSQILTIPAYTLQQENFHLETVCSGSRCSDSTILYPQSTILTPG